MENNNIVKEEKLNEYIIGVLKFAIILLTYHRRISTRNTN